MSASWRRLLAAAALALLLWTRNIALLRLEGVLQQEMEPAIWNHMLRLPSGFFRQFTAGDLVQRVQGIDTIRQLIGGSVLTGGSAAGAIGGAAVGGVIGHEIDKTKK